MAITAELQQAFFALEWEDVQKLIAARFVNDARSITQERFSDDPTNFEGVPDADYVRDCAAQFLGAIGLEQAVEQLIYGIPCEPIKE